MIIFFIYYIFYISILYYNTYIIFIFLYYISIYYSRECDAVIRLSPPHYLLPLAAQSLVEFQRLMVLPKILFSFNIFYWLGSKMSSQSIENIKKKVIILCSLFKYWPDVISSYVVLASKFKKKEQWMIFHFLFLYIFLHLTWPILSLFLLCWSGQ